jgi:formylglycine-generating enzyme required for sulfatase activity
MPTRTEVIRIAILLLGLFLIYVAGRIISTQLSEPRVSDGEIKLIRQLAVSEDPNLAEVLDQSMVYIPAGEFLMGSDGERDNERPQRLVYLDAYEIDRYEITHAQYQRFVKATGRTPPRYWSGSDYPRGLADFPVVGVGWQDADAYCAWSEKRLPTEAEWEKACRGTDGRIFSWGDTWHPDRANIGRPFEEARSGVWDEAWSYVVANQTGSGMPGLRPVGTYPEGASPYGVMDLAGNASEWVWDWYNWGDYRDLPARNPRVQGPPWNRCLRGSSWFIPYGDGAEGRDQSRCAARNSSHTAHGDARSGFRCARTPPDTSD